MAFAPLCQCAFMAGPPQFQKRGPPRPVERLLYDKPPAFEPPVSCEAPPPGAFTLYAFDVEEAKADPKSVSRSMTLDGIKSATLGSSQDHDGQIYDGHKTVQDQHACIYFMRGKWFIKAINGQVSIESMTQHPYLKDSEGRAPRRYTSTSNKKVMTISPIDPKVKLTREHKVFRLGESSRRFWIEGPLPLGEGETEEAVTEVRERKKERKHEAKHEEKGVHEKEKVRHERERSRTRSRSRRRRR
mmetsp:Transcript_29793/g.79202  ORF Transcript_29793/g.79202 Transcript_29793/m.79202 type:complete len:244 (-) Transcript_29793:13-744(-)